MNATRAIVFAASIAFSAACQAKSHAPPKYHPPKASTVTVKGHSTKTGGYVMPHTRTAPDSSRRNNWSYRGNMNPSTGKIGSKDCPPAPLACN